MTPIPSDIHEKLKLHHQLHAVAWWNELTPAEQDHLGAQIRRIDLDELQKLWMHRDEKGVLPAVDRIVPLPWPDNSALDSNRKLGEDAFRAGQVAFLVVAGGQGSRLGFEHPKGMFPVG